jgi:hypothetical protein
MDRAKGYYWVKVVYYQGWHIAYWDGVDWRINGRDIHEKNMEKITETPIPEPEISKTNG